jgi:aldehyde oxidoreductase
VAIGLPDEKVRIVTNPSGGSFGWAINPAATLWRPSAPWRWKCPLPAHELSEFMYFSRQAQRQLQQRQARCDESGKITGAMVDIAVDHGCYRDSSI